MFSSGVVNPLLTIIKSGDSLDEILKSNSAMRLLRRLPLTFGARKHKTLNLEHIPTQNDSLTLPRGSGLALHGPPGNQKKRKVRVIHCYYLML
jgi:hypothetical protein